MQKKSKSDRRQVIDLEFVLVNQVLKSIKPVLHPQLGCVLVKTGEFPELCNPEDDRLELFSKLLESYFRVVYPNQMGFKFPIGALIDTDDEISRHLDTCKVAISRDFYSVIVAIRKLFDDAGVYVTDSDIIRFLVWTKEPRFITPNGWMMISQTTSWFVESGGCLSLCESTNEELKIQPFCQMSTDDIRQALTFKDWDVSVGATSQEFRRRRISLLEIEMLREDTNSSVSSEGEESNNIKEDTNNESIK